MALSAEVLRANEALNELSDTQVAAIETLSQNDENVVIGKKVGELHGQYDEDILSTSGIEKNQGEKSYDYAKRVIGSFKGDAGKVGGFETQIQTLKTEKSDLEKQIQDGKGNEVIAQKLKDTEDKLTQAQNQYNTDKESWANKEKGYQKDMQSAKVDYAFNSAIPGLKFKKEYPETVQRTLLDSAKGAIMGKYTPDWIDDGKGGKVMVFRDGDGVVQNNPENQLNPYTAEELMKSQLKDVLDAGRKAAGGGGQNPNGGGSDSFDIADIGNAKTQIEADDIIVDYLMKKGLTRGSAGFVEEQTKIRNENKVSELPMR